MYRKSGLIKQRSEVRGRKLENRVMWMCMIVLCLSVLVSSLAFAQKKGNITLLIGAPISYKVSQAISDVAKIPEAANRYDFCFYSNNDLENGNIDPEIVSRSKIIIVDYRYANLKEYILKNADFGKAKVHGLCSAENKPEKIVSDPKIEQYFDPATVENIKNLLLFILNRDCHLDLSYDEPQIIPKVGIFHSQSSKIFTSFKEYFSWYEEKGLFTKGGFWVGIADSRIRVLPGETEKIVSSLIHNLEKSNINVLPVYSHPSYLASEKFFFDEKGKSRVDLITTFSFRHAGINDERTIENLKKLGVPLLNTIRLYHHTIPEWRESPQGIGPMQLSHDVCSAEFNGLIEPSVLGGKVVMKDKRTGKEVYEYRPIKENIEFLIKRIEAWRNLQIKPNKDKKIAIIYYNHPPGKHNVGAAYLNVFRSLEKILRRMQQEGYTTKGDLPSEKEIKAFVLKSGRNIGSWASGELDALINSKKVIRLPVAEYLEWYKEIDTDYKEKLEAEWGKVEDSKIMIKDKEIIIPYVNLGNIILLPQPSRGWGDDPIKLYHSTQLWPHHQYTAFYLWLKKKFGADAVIHLGTHGTHEWLPGKQIGLSQSCPPEVLIQDIPNIYAYLVDAVGEGIQAKRRGRAVIIDHLIPAMKKAGAYEEYRDLAVLIDNYNDALSHSAELAAQKFKRIGSLVKKLGLDKDLLLQKVDEEAMEEIEHYLMDLQVVNMPYGMHTFGISPEGEQLKEFSQLIKERSKELNFEEIKKNLSLCYLELDSLITSLDGKYILAGEGNDPIRNPEAIPTGRNFYGFDPAKVPSKDAYVLGKQQAEKMVEKYLKEKGEYPEKIGLVLFGVEIHRNEGTQIGAALHLLGMKPVWDENNKVTGVEPIPGKLLGRPRIDIHLQTSGLYRDSFPNISLLLDEAVRQAAKLKDVENFIAIHNRKIKDYLLTKGYCEEEAENLSKIRVFSPRPGSYGAKVGELIPNSGLWEGDEEVADAFINYGSFGYGKGVWGKSLKSVYKKNLEDVKITMHNMSSSLKGVLDNDDYYGFLGGLAMAVKRVSGEYPDVLISDQRVPDAAHIEDIERTIGEELRSRYLNPKWIEGMKKDNYAGARLMSMYLENIWGWQVTTPFAIDKTMWEQIHEVYIDDKYGLDLREFFDKNNPWAHQSIAARMLEADRKKYWKAPEEMKKKLARTYTMNVIEKGVACCEHTCNNPMLQQFVANIISLYGLLTPQQLDQFKMVIAKATGRTQEENEAEYKKTRESLKKTVQEIQKEESVKAKTEGKKIEGFEMVDAKPEDTKVTASGSEWMVMAIVIGLLVLLFAGWKRKI